MLSENSMQRIERIPSQLQKPVRLVLFLSDTGCPSCAGMVELCRAIKARSSRIVLETYDIVMDRDKSDLYGIRRAPSLVVQGGEGQWGTISGNIEGYLLDIVVKAIVSLSFESPWFPEPMARALRHLTESVATRIFTRADDPDGAAVSDTALGTALASTHVSTEIVNTATFADLAAQNRITRIPTTLFGDQFRLEGRVPISEFLETLFQVRGTKPGPEKKCLVCGTPSADTICGKCKNRIQAEAVEHKLKAEKTLHHDTP